MNIPESIRPNELLQQAKEKGFPFSNSAIKCSTCSVVFPVEYNKCPQCEVNKLRQTLNLQINSFGGK
jgi:hypothetical protein